MVKYIDAEALKSIFEAKSDMATGTPKMCFASVVKMIDKLPAADVAEVKHGEWENYPSHAHRRCSICKIEHEKPRFNVRANFCPNCGSKMKG